MTKRFVFCLAVAIVAITVAITVASTVLDWGVAVWIALAAIGLLLGIKHFAGNYTPEELDRIGLDAIRAAERLRLGLTSAEG